MTLDELKKEIEDLKARVLTLENQRMGAVPGDLFFEKFWNLYPRKVEKAAAIRAWAAMSNADKVAATEGVVKYVGVWNLAEPERCNYIKHPASWLRARSWEDGEVEWRKVAHVKDVPRPALPGAHKDPAREDRDLGTAPAHIRDIANRIVRRELTTEEEDQAYYRWCGGEDE